MAIDPVSKNYVTAPSSSNQTKQTSQTASSSSKTTAQTPAATYTKSPEAVQAAMKSATPSGAVHKIASSEKEIKENIAAVKANARPMQVGPSKPAATAKPEEEISKNVAQNTKTQATAAKGSNSNQNPVNKEEIMAAASALRQTIKGDINSAISGAALGKNVSYTRTELPKVVTKAAQPTAAVEPSSMVDVTG